MLYSHNQKVYREITNLLDSGENNLILIQGMGTGKSFVFMELAKDYFWNKRILYIVPQLTIESNIRKYPDFVMVQRHVDFWTYHIFKDDETILRAYDNYDVFVIDEAHHLGSKLYGNNLQTLLSLVKDTGNKKIFIGMTATPVRHSDKQNVKRYFDNEVVGLSTLDAIQQGLMPQVEYLLCSSDVNSIDKRKYNVQIDYKDSRDLLKQIVRDNPKARWLCYYGKIKDLRDNREIIKELFPGYHIVEITSDTEDSQNKIDDISDDENAVICSVDKLLEGIHLPNMDGVLLFRNVYSLTVFAQIFGRITEIGKIETPLFVDCTDTGIRLLNRLEGLNPNPEGTLRERAIKKRPVLYTSLKNKKYFDINNLLQTIELETIFDQRLSILKEYMEEHNCDINKVPHNATTKDGFKIGGWLYRQKKAILQLPDKTKQELGII